LLGLVEFIALSSIFGFPNLLAGWRTTSARNKSTNYKLNRPQS